MGKWWKHPEKNCFMVAITAVGYNNYRAWWVALPVKPARTSMGPLHLHIYFGIGLLIDPIDNVMIPAI